MKRPSFQFYPGDWRGTRWVLFDPSVSFGVPILPACYAVYLDGDMRYVGQTMNLRKRLQNHKIGLQRYSGGYQSPWGDAKKIIVKARFGSKFGDWAMREMRLINRLQPAGNCLGSIRKRG